MSHTIPHYEIFKAIFFTPNSRGGFGLPLLIWGKPGAGKTSIVEAVGRAFAAPTEVLSPGEKGEGFFGTIPAIKMIGERQVVSHPTPEWALAFPDYGLVLVDELTTAPPAVSPALLSLSLRGEIGGFRFGKRVRILAAANPVECAANGYPLSPPMANRFIHLDFKASVSNVCAFLTGDQTEAAAPIDVAAEEARALEVFPAAYAMHAARVAAFLKRHPDLLDAMPDPTSPEASRAWPSPRSWDMLVRVLAAGTIHSLSSDDIDTLASGTVGANAYGEFCSFLAQLDLPDPATVLDLGTWSPNMSRLDAVAATLAACTALVVSNMTTARASALWRLLDKVGSLGARDLTIEPAKALIKAKGLTVGTAADRAVAIKVLGEQKVADLNP